MTGKDTAGRHSLIDMYVPPAGGPPPHRYAFEESFMVPEGEIEVTFRGLEQTIRAAQVINIPANAPHQLKNKQEHAARLLCYCSPAGLEELFVKSAFQLQRAP